MPTEPERGRLGAGSQSPPKPSKRMDRHPHANVFGQVDAHAHAHIHTYESVCIRTHIYIYRQ
eukprot:6182938-Pleurochrysis_carterae.AAC.2